MKKHVWNLGWLLGIALVIFLYMICKVRFEVGTYVYSYSSDCYTEQLQDGDSESVEFTFWEDTTVKNLQFAFVTYGVSDQAGEIQVEVVSEDSGETVATGSITVSDITEWAWTEVNFDTPVSAANGETWVVTLTAVDFTEDNALSIAQSSDGNLGLRMDSGIWDAFQKLFVIFSLLVFALILFAYLAFFVYHVKIEYVFVVCFTTMALIFNVMVPAKLGPDEAAHLNTVYKISENLMGWESSADDKEVITEEEAENGLSIDAPNETYYNNYISWLTSKSSDESQTEQSYWGSQENPQITYFMAALGIVVGRLLHLSAAGIITVGRMFSFIPVLLLLFYAIKRTPVGKEIIFVLALVPSMVQEATTINADGIDIAMSIALTAAVLRVAYGEKDKFRYLDYGLIVLLSYILSRCKFGALVPMAMLPLLLFFRYRKSTEKEERILKYAGLALPIVCVLFGFLPLISTTVTAYSQDLWTEYYSFSDILANPKHIFYMIINTIHTNMDFYLLSMGGTYLGWMNIILPQHISVIMIVLVLLSAVPTEVEAKFLSGKARLYMFLVGLAGIGCSVGGMLIGWTTLDSEVINGVQGRYFLPFVVLLALAIRPGKILVEEGGTYRKKVCMAIVWVQLLVVSALFIRAL